MAKSLNTNGGPYENRTRLSRLKIRRQRSEIKPHSDSSDHVHGMEQQPVTARVGMADPNELSIQCYCRPRAAGGRLSHCIPCIKEAAEARVAN